MLATAAIKVHRVYFTPVDWLGGTVRLTNAERGVYITACALIYDLGGAIDRKVIADWCRGVPRATFALINRLIAAGKLVDRGDGMIDQPRCERELDAARGRIEAWSENAGKGGRPRSIDADRESIVSRLRVDCESIVSTKPAETLAREKPSGFESKTKSEKKKVIESEGLSGCRASAAPLDAEPAETVDPVPKPPEADWRAVDGAGSTSEVEAGLAPRRSGARRGPDAVVSGRAGRMPAGSGGSPAPSLASDNLRRHSEAERAEVDRLVERCRTALAGDVPKAIRDADAYGGAIAARKFHGLIHLLCVWSGTALAGAERLAAWEALAAADKAGSRAAMNAAERTALDQVDRLYRLSWARVAA